MRDFQEGQHWFTARELAEIAKARGLIRFPQTERGWQIHAKRADWGAPSTLSRKRSGQKGGGGFEYHFAILPQELQGAIVSIEGRAEQVELQRRALETARATLDHLTAADALKIHGMPARQRDVMNARSEVLLAIEGYGAAKGEARAWAIRMFLEAQTTYEVRLEVEARREGGERLTTDEAMSLAHPLLLCAHDGFGLSPERLSLANDRRGKAHIGRSAIYNWFKDRDERGLIGLAPAATKSAAPIPPGFSGFLKFYARPTKPAATDALREYMKTVTDPAMALTLDQVRHVMRVKLNNIEKEVGREGILTLRSRLAYVSRTTEDMWPTTIYTADGKTFDAEIADLVTRRPMRPEITTVLDVVTRKVVGYSVARSENQRSVAEALRKACSANGIPAIFYVDRGPGYRNAALDADISGLMGRLAITKMHAAPYGSQAKGRIERPNATIWDVLAKRLPTYIGRDMDKEAGDKVHKLTRREMREFGQSKILPSWDEFIALCDAMIAEYNDAPHLGLPYFTEPKSGKRRHMSPNEAWAAHVANGFEPVLVDQEEENDLFRPYEIRQSRRAEVFWNGNSYFDHALQPYHDKKVMVGYDYHQADRVWVREFDVKTGQPGRLICVAHFMANAERYVPVAYEQSALEKRAMGRLQRNERKRRDIEAERDSNLLEFQPEEPVAFQQVAQSEPMPDAHSLPEVNDKTDAIAAIAPRRRVFRSDEELALWALENPDQLKPNQIAVLRDCMSNSTARKLFQLSGVDTEALRTLLRAVA